MFPVSETIWIIYDWLRSNNDKKYQYETGVIAKLKRLSNLNILCSGLVVDMNNIFCKCIIISCLVTQCVTGILPTGSKTLATGSYVLMRRIFKYVATSCQNFDVNSNASSRESAMLSAFRNHATTLWWFCGWPVASLNFCPYPIYPYFWVAVKLSKSLFASRTCTTHFPLEPTINLVFGP